MSMTIEQVHEQLVLNLPRKTFATAWKCEGITIEGQGMVRERVHVRYVVLIWAVGYRHETPPMETPADALLEAMNHWQSWRDQQQEKERAKWDQANVPDPYE